MRIPLLALFCSSLVAPGLALAQVTVKPDGQWRHLFGVSASFASGNTRASSVNLAADTVRATDHDKLSLTARALYAKNQGKTSANRAAAGADYNRDLTRDWFGFGRGEYLRDRPANLAHRWAASSGVGYHLIRQERGFWDVSAGLGYSEDRYVDPVEIEGRTRERYGRTELVLAEESNFRLTDSTNFRQKLMVLPNLEEQGTWRAEFDSGLSVAMTERLSLTAGLTYRYNSDPGDGVKRGDALFLTGVSLRID
ncbi:DUF481 domain-containing protein [Aquabacterium sp. A7-Y]|uniref:DUF481 domain-containing protein n=1 Tax=Aquabacterium sp. A7-Y TaxID=1349605 RepID=UPI00223CE072|nr:DUF481 domain-containing protein [Aquabacterium sp. A7-Y]MCW7539084.1 DUF481 domain-containing protein [Aquabacterium sp. A7-Y]